LGVAAFVLLCLSGLHALILPFSRIIVRARATFLIVLGILSISLNISAQQSIKLQWPLTSPQTVAIPNAIASLGFSAGREVDSLYFTPSFGAVANGWNTDNLDPEAYYEYTITPAPGTSMVINQLNFEVSLSRVNMRTSVQYSYDGFRSQKSQIGHTIYIATHEPRNLPVKTSLRVSYPQTLSIRIYGWSSVDYAVSFHNRNVTFDALAFGKNLLADAPEETEPELPVVEEINPETIELAEVEPQAETPEALAAVTPQDTLVISDGGERGIMAGDTYGPGTFTWTSLANVTCIKVEAWAGGGGGSTVTTNSTRGGGGGGGGYARSSVAVAPSTNYAVVVGSGGGANTAGGNSIFGANVVVAAGGSGASPNSVTAGPGGTASTGDFTWAGGNGANGATISGGGGGGAGSNEPGYNASNSVGGAGGNVGGGKGGDGVNVESNGNFGNTLGGAGSGGHKGTGAGTFTGGSGAGGQIRITYISQVFAITPAGNHCYGTAISIGLSGSETGITYQLIRDGFLIASMNGTGGSLSFGTYSVAGIYTVRATINQCTCTTDMTGSVVIHPAITIALGSIQPICEGTTSASLPYNASTTQGSPDKYSIDFNPTAEGQGFVDVVNQNLSGSPILITVPAAAAPGNYNATLIVTNSTTNCNSISYPITVTIRANPVAPVEAQASQTEICNNYTTNITLTASGGSGGTLRWYRGACGSILVGAGTPLSIVPPTVTTTYFARWENSPCTPSTCASVQVVVRPPVSNPGAISGVPIQCPFLTNQSYSISAVANATNYTWTVPSGWTITSGQGTNAILATTGATGGTISVTAGNVCGNSIPSNLNVTVNPGIPATPGAITGNAAQCPNLTNQIYSIAAVANATTYTWIVPTGWTITGGAGTNSITVTTGNTGQGGNISVTAGNSCGTSAASTLAVTVGPGTPATPGTISGTVNYCNQQTGKIYSVVAVPNATSYNWTVPTGWNITAGGGTNNITVTTGTPGQNGNITVSAQNYCGTSAVSTLAVTVSTTPVSAGTITPEITNVCEAGTYNFSVAAAPPAGVTYTWSVPADWSINSGQETASINVTVGQTSGTVSMTPSNLCGPGPASSLPLTVDLLPAAAGVITGDNDICEASVQTYSISAVTGATNYLWTVPGDWTINSGQGTTSIEITAGLTSGTVQVTPQNSCGNGPASTLSVTVNPLPAAITGPDGDVCLGGTVQIGGPRVPENTYLWTAVPPDPEMDLNVSDPFISPEVDTYYTLTETTPAGCSRTNTVFVQVTIEVIINLNTTAQTICSGGTTNITISSNVLSPAISWEASLISGSGVTFNPNGTGSPISETLINNSGSPAVVRYAIKVVGYEGCYNTAVADVTVNPVNNPSISGPATVCQNSTGNVYSTETSMSYYNWSVTGGNITAGQGSNQITVTWTTPGAQTVNVSYINSYGCPGSSTAYNVTVNPIPVITVVPDTQGPICSGSPIQEIDFTESVSGTTYNWTRDNTVILTGIPASGTSNSISGTLTSSQPATLQTTIFTITATANGCNYETTAEVKVGDVTPPSITCKPSPQNRTANTGVCNYTAIGTEFDPESWGDNCPGATLSNSFNSQPTLAGALFLSGVTTVTWTVTAANWQSGNGQTASCTITINVEDDENPTITFCPTDVTVYTGAGSTTCSQVATWTEPTANDNCGGGVTWTRSHIPGSVFPVGTTLVTYIATDGSGNTATCTFNVIVIDNTPPTFTCPDPVTVNLSSSCTYDIGVGVTGNVTVKFDNCTPQSELNPTYSDGPFVPGDCPGTGSVTRTWTLTDANNNTTTCTQLITISDNIAPDFTNVTNIANIIVSCHQGTDPSVTGQATATDNCSPVVNLSYTDVVVPDLTCPAASVITRTWTATDCIGNAATRVQTITVRDNVPPVVTNPGHMVVACPSDIPDPDPNTVEAYDLCGNVTITFESEVAQFPPAIPGYCPDYVIRTYKVMDECGNITMVQQSIDVIDPLDPACDCQECLTQYSHYDIDFSGQPSGDTTIYGVSRLDYCCHAQHPTKCVSFSIYLDEGSVGLQIWVSGGFQKTDWKVDCENVEISNDGIVCLPGGTYYLFTYCKPGANENNDFRFTALAGILLGGDVEARVNCNSQLSVNTSATSATWNSVYPGTPGQYNSYLSCTDCLNPIFTPGPGSPATIIYEVCGVIPDQPCVGFGGAICDQVTVHVRDEIHVEFNVDPGAFCQGLIPEIIATITPSGTTYILEWYDAQGGTGNIVGTGYNFTPPAAGNYSLVVHDTDEGIPCSTLIYDFFVAPDNTPPNVFPPEAPLQLECNDPQNAQLIIDWLATAYAEDDHNVIIRFEHDFTSITQSCNSVLTVTFTAEDECNNIGTGTAIIRINDTQIPTWNTAGGALDRTVECSDAAALAAAQALAPNATDLCDPTTLVITKTSGAFVPGSCPQAGTYTNRWTATDLCGNVSAIYEQIITITDITAPVWTTTAGSLNRTVDCNDAAALAAAQALVPAATDNCDATLVPVKTSGDFVPGDPCANAGTYTNTFVVTDDCGNASTVFTQIITLTDLIGPVLDQPAIDLTVECDGTGNTAELNAWLNNNGGAIANDACGDVTWTHNFTSLSDDCGATGAATVIFTATDACDNFVTTEATFTIADTQSPSITCPADVTAQINTVNCTVDNVDLGTPVTDDDCSDVTVTNDAPAEFPAGVTIVTWTATDACGNSATCQQTVTVEDLIPPTVDCPVDVSVNADPGLCSANVTVPAPNVTDPCPYTMTNDYTGNDNASGVYPVGTTTVIWTITGISGVSETCTQYVTVTDNQAPTINCPDNQVFTATPPDCELIISTIPDPVLTDNCDVADLILTWEALGATPENGTGSVNGTVFPVGVTTVAYTVTDLAGLTATCQFTVTVSSDIPPTITNCPPHMTVNNDPGSCSANITVPEPYIEDPCNEIVSVTNDFNGTGNASGVYPVGLTIVVWSIEDFLGNVDTCQQRIRVVDAELPTIICPDNIYAIATPPLCEVPDFELTAPVYNDNCSEYILSWIMEMDGSVIDSGNGELLEYTFSVGTTTITYTITDAAGNSDDCSFNVVINNEVPPLIINCPEDITENAALGHCNLEITVPGPDIDDPCFEIVSVEHDSPYGISSEDASGVYPVGVWTITWTITDEWGETDECEQIITIIDNQAPVLICPENVEQEILNGGCELSDVIIPDPEISDNCEVITLTWEMTGATTGNSPSTGINFVSGETFSVGVTYVTYTATDEAGHTVNCTFWVWMKNLDAPQFSATCPSDPDPVPANENCEAYVTVPAPVIDNPCNELYTVENDSPYADDDASGIYPVGTTEINWIITDASGNITNCVQTITVTDDENPSIICPENVEQEILNGGCELSDVIIPDPELNDNCEVTALTWEMSGATIGSSPLTGMNYVSGETFSVGITYVTYTAYDAAGNSATCEFEVWIKSLNAPEFQANCPADMTVYTTADRCDADVIVTRPEIINPCDELYTMTCASPYGDDPDGIYPVGTTTITWTITDASGIVTVCEQDITVIDDIDPTLDCPDPITVNADLNQNYASNVTVPEPYRWDACNIEHLSYVSSDPTPLSSPLTGIYIFPSPYTFNVGTTTITYTATDFNGNVSTCEFTVTVLSKPEITCPGNFEVDTDPGLCSATLDPGYPTLIEGAEPITWTYSITNEAGVEIGSGTCTTATLPTCLGLFTFPVGVNTIVWNATNISGFDECIQTITVTDNEAPTFTAPGPFDFCVINIISAQYDGQPEPAADIIPINPADGNPRRPDWYLVASGSTELDLTDVLDNCCELDDIDIEWTITFDPITGYPPISGSGQPSLSTPIQLWGTHTNVEVNHTITYTVTDCNGNEAAVISRNILIRPRPEIIKQY